MTLTITIASGTTGVGKSSLTHNLAAALARRGQRVRAIGLDRQKTLSLWNGVDVDAEPGIGLHIGDVLVGRERVPTGETNSDGTPVFRLVGLADAERETSVPGYTIVPESTQLEGDIITLTRDGGLSDVLRMELEDAPSIDLNLIDAPGEANPLSVAALAVSDKIIVVVSPTGKGTEIAGLLARIERMRQRRQTRGEIAGIVPSIVPSVRQGGVYQDILESLRLPSGEGGYGDLVTRASIREQHLEAEAYLLGQPLVDAFPKAKITQDYWELVAELDERGVTSHGLPTSQSRVTAES